MLAGLDSVDAAPQGVAIHARCGGAGPPLLLLHGHPQTHLMWHRVAPALAQHFSVVAADLRGYGDSARVPADADHAAHSKRTMALDMLGLMDSLGHRRFAVLAHDRGARVAAVAIARAVGRARRGRQLLRCDDAVVGRGRRRQRSRARVRPLHCRGSARGAARRSLRFLQGVRP